MEKGRYVFRILKTRDGEREYYHKGLHRFDEEVTKEQAEEFLEDYTQNFWWGEEGEKEDYYYWFFGEIVTWLYNWKFVTEEEFNVLSKFI